MPDRYILSPLDEQLEGEPPCRFRRRRRQRAARRVDIAGFRAVFSRFPALAPGFPACAAGVCPWFANAPLLTRAEISPVRPLGRARHFCARASQAAARARRCLGRPSQATRRASHTLPRRNPSLGASRHTSLQGMPIGGCGRNFLATVLTPPVSPSFPVSRGVFAPPGGGPAPINAEGSVPVCRPCKIRQIKRGGR